MLGLLDKNKGVGALIVKKMMSPKDDMHEKAENESDYDMALKTAAEKIMNAIHTKDLQSLLEGMKEFHTMYDEQMEQEEAMEGPEEVK